MVKKTFFAAISFLGWVLSPFTWWNDAFVNLPLAYIAATIISKLAPENFLPAFLISYWLTNILGIVLMYIGAGHLPTKEVIRSKRAVFLSTLVIYSLIAAILIISGVIKPF